ncbi:MAG: sugar phosphate isomerase/epimerase family protein [Planctomycetota bacterium]
MRYAICNELFQDWPWEKALELSRQLGYTGWEIAPFTMGDAPTELPAAKRAELAKTIQDADTQVVGLHWLLAKTDGFYLTTDDGEVRERTAVYLGDLARLCRDLGGSIMVLGSPHQRNFPDSMTHEQADNNTISVLEQVIPVLEEHDVTLALEPLGPGEGNYWNEARQAVAVIEKLASKNVQLHLDVKAMSSEPEPIADVIRANAKHMVHFHANDPNLLGPGMGEVPFEPIFGALKEIDYQGWVSVEVFDYAPGIETICSESMENMRSAVASCGA